MFGTVGGDSLAFTGGGVSVDAPLDELRDAHGALAPLFP